MRINLECRHAKGPADLVWGLYRNANAPWPEVALQLFTPSGECITKATVSLAAYDAFPMPGHIILALSGANEGVADCLVREGVVEFVSVPIEIGDERFQTARVVGIAAEELKLYLMAPSGKPN